MEEKRGGVTSSLHNCVTLSGNHWPGRARYAARFAKTGGKLDSPRCMRAYDSVRIHSRYSRGERATSSTYANKRSLAMLHFAITLLQALLELVETRNRKVYIPSLLLEVSISLAFKFKSPCEIPSLPQSAFCASIFATRRHERPRRRADTLFRLVRRMRELVPLMISDRASFLT